MKLFLLLIAGVCGFAQIERPRLGFMLDQNNDARPVTGTLASATPGDPVLHGVLSMACSAQQCLAKTDAAVVSTSGDTANAPAGPAIFGGPYIYFPQSQILARWEAGIVEPVPFTADGEVLALRAAGDGLDYAVERGGATWIEHVSLIDNSLRVLNMVPEAHAAILRNGETLLATDDAVHLLRPDGTETVLAAPAVQSFVVMGDGCVEFVSPQGMWGFDWLRNQVFLLPGVAE